MKRLATADRQTGAMFQRVPGGTASPRVIEERSASLVILSMCSIAGEFGFRGLESPLAKNRINVAFSWAQTLVIVVGNPRIATTAAANIKQMNRIEELCRLTSESFNLQPPCHYD
jgi:hypothetical protein